MNDQKAKHSDKIDINALNVRAEGAAADLAEAEFVGGHGIIARDKGGKMLTKVDGHSYDKTKVEEVVKMLLEKG